MQTSDEVIWQLAAVTELPGDCRDFFGSVRCARCGLPSILTQGAVAEGDTRFCRFLI